MGVLFRSIDELKSNVSELSERVQVIEGRQGTCHQKASVRCPTEVSVSLQSPC